MMRGRSHLLVHGIFIIILLFLSFNLLDSLMRSIDSPKMLDGFGIFIVILLFLLTAILPDSDSNDAGSMIFYTPLFIFGWIHRLMEFPVMIFTYRPRGHRESLHTVLGAFVTSIFWVIILLVIFREVVSLRWFIIWFITLFIGQLLHFLEDWHFKLK